MVSVQSGRGVERWGKSVVLACRRGAERRYLVAELGMTGLLLLPSAPFKHPQHTHFRILFDGCAEQEVRYWNPRRFGRLSLLDQNGLDQYTGRRFGYDPLGMTFEEFKNLLQGNRSRLKSLLMRQQAIAGIGNIYANEILFRAKLHPNQIANEMQAGRLPLLYEAMQLILHEAIALGGSSVRDYFAPDGTEGQYKRRHLVYAKAGLPCPNRCGALIRRSVGERTSFYCPSCQRIRQQTTKK
ncbi:MAG: DNA-formamidopyrimidine glycosylase family protein [Nitrospiraceae bacterium]